MERLDSTVTPKTACQQRRGRTALTGLGLVAVLISAVLAGRWLRSYSSQSDTDSRPVADARVVAAPSSGPVAGTPLDKRGEVVFQVYCAKCHGPEGHGDPAAISTQRPPPRDFAARPWRYEVSANSIRRVTLEGIPGTAMPAHRVALSGDDLEAVVSYTYRLATTGSTIAAPTSPLARALAPAGFTPELPPRTAPQLTLSDATGRIRTLADERGRIVLLQFWGTSCEHCLAGMPKLQSLADQWEPRGLTVLSICADAESAESAQGLVKNHSPRTQVWIDMTGLANVQFEVQTLPMIWLIDADGQLLARAHGMQEWDSPPMRDLLELLVERVPPQTAP
jgi:mono/diheme cytochrome c family protein/peroxiredoxin